VTPDELPAASMGRPVADPFTLAFECSGRAAACEAALDQLARAGTFVFLGTGAESPRVNHNRVIILELTLLGSYNYDERGFEAALALIAGAFHGNSFSTAISAAACCRWLISITLPITSRGAARCWSAPSFCIRSPAIALTVCW